VEFIENKGQIADQFGNINWDVLFIAEVEGGTIAIRRDGISFTFIKNDETAIQKRKTNDKLQGMHKVLSAIEPSNIEMYRVDMKLNNARIPRKIATKEMTGDYNNYYLAHCPEGITFVRKYRTVVLEDVYENIDLVLYGNAENKFQYDFVVKPGGDPNRINFRFEGAEKVEISTKGDLKVSTPLGDIEQKKPVAYQLASLNSYTNSRSYEAKGNNLQSRFIKNEDNSISFAVSNYDRSKPLIIDPPTRLWGTYYGGSGGDWGNSVAVDGSGNVYLAGYTQSSDAIATSGAHQSTFGGNIDAFLVKFNSSGIRQWGTYYGGSG